MASIGLIPPVHVQVSFNLHYQLLAGAMCQMDCFSGCDCNLSGTSGGSSMCDDDTGICNCDANQGYDGDKCDDCLVGWYWTASDSTCTSKSP